MFFVLYITFSKAACILMYALVYYVLIAYCNFVILYVKSPLCTQDLHSISCRASHKIANTCNGCAQTQWVPCMENSFNPRTARSVVMVHSLQERVLSSEEV